MAYVPNQNEDEQNQNQQGTQSVQQLSGQTSNIGSSGTNTFNQAQQRQDVGTGFTNINRYLEENEPQSERMTGQITSNIEQSGQQARQGIQESQNLFNQGVQSQTVQQDQDLFNQVQTDPTAVTSSEDRFNTFLQARDAQYTGPDTFEESDYYQPTFQQVQQAQQTADKVLTDVGRKDLAADLNPEGRTTRGMGTLDNLFLSGEQPRQQLFQTRESFADLPDRLQETSQFATQAVQDARTTNQATREAAQQALESSRNTFQSDIDTRLQSARDASESNFNKINQALQTGEQLTDTDRSIMGIDDEKFEQINDRIRQANEFREEYGTGEVPYGLGTVANLTARDYNRIVDNNYSGYTMDAGTRTVIADTWNNAIKETNDYNTLYGTNITAEDYVTYVKPETGITINRLATEQDYARQQALEQLMGSEIDYITSQDKLGTAAIGGINPEDYQSLVGGYDTYLTQLEDEYNQMIAALDNADTTTKMINR